MISEQYRRMNAALHTAKPEYGNNGHVYASAVAELITDYGGTVLDYGCGKARLSEVIPCACYDPAVERFSAMPGPADIVVCTDVLEHVEPEHLDRVLDHIKALTRKAALIVVALRKAKKSLADGRNAHLIIESDQWWRDKIGARFTIKKFKVRTLDDAFIIGEAK